MDLNFPTATPDPLDCAAFKSYPADFQVQEIFDPALDEQGEHCYLLLRKTDCNTQWVADLLARALQVKPMAVGYCGMKDRRAITVQWFSVHAGPPSEAHLRQLDELSQGLVEVLQIARGSRKLRRGMHAGNQFRIRLAFDDAAGALRAKQHFEKISASGVPNYFGAQRFGSNGNNLHRAKHFFQAPSRKRPAGIVISAARSWLFNLVLAARVRNGSWADADAYGEELVTGPMWGRGRNPVSGELRDFEQSCLTEYADWCLGLEHCGLSFERRPLVNLPEHCSVEVDDASAWFNFRLPPGCFATSVLAECAQLRMPERQDPGEASSGDE